ncbi:hypothetical protein [Pelagicoccus sp. SDUM812002]|uniref:hypothetical protein n=1 Tax=Pelagicoccus sp. SDUM812002 TaxID=3041266 RepID=UPI00280E8F4C|nr:hypothetical protein [Pelagicoccus sp. SDUM812002]MDQ8184469.1 hypothetical protein [Pelagicoccus sp. SDUM812002]
MSRTDGISTGGAVAFSPCESRIVFACRNADGGDSARLALMELDLGTGEVIKIDLTNLGEIAEPSEISFLKASNSVLVRSKYDYLYVVDLSSNSYSPIKYMRLGPIAKDERSLRDQIIAVSDTCFATFDGRGRIELGSLLVSQTGIGNPVTLGESGLFIREVPEVSYRLLRSEDGSVWIDNGFPGNGEAIDLSDLAGRLVRVAWQEAD